MANTLLVFSAQMSSNPTISSKSPASKKKSKNDLTSYGIFSIFTMNTLERKGFLRREKIGLVNFYKPTRTRKQVIQTEMTSFISRVFDGSVPALANYLIDTGDMTLEQIRDIKAVLTEKENELKDSNDV